VPTSAAASSREPLFETSWVNKPLVVLFTVGALLALASFIWPTLAAVTSLPQVFSLPIAVLWAYLAAANLRRRLSIYEDRIVARPFLGAPREIARVEQECLKVIEPQHVPAWQRAVTGCGRRPMLLADSQSPCAALFRGATLAGMPLELDQADLVSELLSKNEFSH
jgi:hypothetical protein